jgi:AcrR family transcriptional regulator
LLDIVSSYGRDVRTRERHLPRDRPVPDSSRDSVRERAVTASAKDRRILRTLAALRAAMIALMVEKDWEDISVQDLCDRANVGRSTFYTHFDDKDQLLMAGFEHMRRELRAARTATSPSDRLGWARAFIDHADEQRALFRALLGRRSGHHVQKRFRRLLVESIRQDTGVAEPVVHYIAGAFFELLTWWVEARSDLAAAEIERLFRRLTAPAIAAVS